MSDDKLTIYHDAAEELLVITQEKRIDSVLKPNRAITVSTSTAYFNGVTKKKLNLAFTEAGCTVAYPARPPMIVTKLAKQKPMTLEEVSAICLKAFGFTSDSFIDLVRQVEDFHNIVADPSDAEEYEHHA